MFDITENTKVIVFQHPVSASGAAIGTDWVSMKNATKATFLIDHGAGAPSCAYTIYVATDLSGTNATAIASADGSFAYLHTLSGDTWTKVSSGSIFSASVATMPSSTNSTMFAIEVKAADLGNLSVASTLVPVSAVRISGAADASLIRSAICILTGLRYEQDAPPTAL